MASGVELSDDLKRSYESWQTALMDLGGRNQLINFKDYAASTLTITGKSMTRVRAGVRYLDVVADCPADMRADVAKRASKILKRHQGNLEERGVATLMIGSQLVSWQADGKSYRVPVVLQSLEAADATRYNDVRELALVEESAAVNPSLLPLLRDVFKIHGAADAVGEWSAVVANDVDTAEWSLVKQGRVIAAALQKLLGEAGRDAGVEDVLIVGNFDYSRLPMVADLGAALSRGVQNELVAALAGDVQARTALAEGGSPIMEPGYPNRVAPAAESLVLDADSSQSLAIRRAEQGQSIVIQGPPGTGKSQTIANLIASLIAAGKTVLFVAEKRAAIDAVVARLTAVELDHLLFELHGRTADKKWIYQELSGAFEAMGAVLPATETPAAFKRSRAVLHETAEDLHTPHPSWDLSPYEVMSSLIDLRSRVQVPVPRLAGLAGRCLTKDAVEHRVDLVRQLAEAGGYTRLVRDSAWMSLRTDDPDAVHRANTAVGWATANLPQVWAGLQQLTNGSCDTVDDLLGNAANTLTLGRVAAGLTSELVLSGNITNLARIDGGSKATSGGEKLGWWARRRMAKAAKAAATPEAVGATYSDLIREAARIDGWRQARWGTQLPVDLNRLHSFHQAAARFVAEMEVLFPTVPWRAMTLHDVEERFRRLVAQQLDVAARVPHVHALEQRLYEEHLGELLPALIHAEANTHLAADLARLAMLQLVEEQMRLRIPMLATLTAELLDVTAATFRQEDRNHISGKAQAISRTAALRLKNALDAEPAGYQLLKASMAKSRRQPGLRALAEQVPDLLFAAQPCWAMSPLEVCQVLPLTTQFDVVIFDEASQVRPHEAVPSLLRARQAVIAGDRHQLPPTAFFDATNDIADGDVESHDYESLLDATSAYMRNCLLTWHYRSQDERLIAVSNRHIYDNNLVTFPSTGIIDAIEFHQVDQTVDAEIATVVALVKRQAEIEPDRSIGVITFSLKHADRVQAAIEQAAVGSSSVEKQLLRAAEPLFVKNIERVQGDERDIIIVSPGYTKDIHGRLPQRFGPINHDGGERRLNVVASRARRKMILAASFTAADIADDSPRRGVQVLRAFVDFMHRGGVMIDTGAKPIPLNAFERDIRDKLQARGLELVPQYGCSGYRIDFAVRDPNRPGQYVLAIEADGASYHSQPTARDRDRLRQEHLERLGWRFHRIWSTAWFRNAAVEVEKAYTAYLSAIEGATSPAPTADSIEVDPVSPADTAALRRRFPASTGLEIGAYTDAELRDVALWILEDGHIRTTVDLVDRMREELGFRRRGSKIQARLTQAAEQVERGVA